MLSGIKFIPRDQLEEQCADPKRSKRRSTKRDRRRRKKDRYEKCHSHSSSDSDSSSTPSSSNMDCRKKKKEVQGSDYNEVVETRELDRREVGLDWMVNPARGRETKVLLTSDALEESNNAYKEEEHMNPRELNPYLKNNGGGYPDEPSLGRNHLLTSSVVGDGGASWRLKALKRAKEQAEREGRQLGEVVEERWGSLGQLTASVAASRKAAPARAHLHAIHSRKKGKADSPDPALPDQSVKDNEESKSRRKSYLEDASSHSFEMRKPKSYSWRKGKDHHSSENKSLISDAISGLNKFSNDGSFMDMVGQASACNSSSMHVKENDNKHPSPSNNITSERESSFDKELDLNQLAAKAFQLRLKGKHEEAEMLLKDVETMKQKQSRNIEIAKPRSKGRYMEGISSSKKMDEDSDLYLAQKIARNKQFSISKQADDEYDFDDDPPKRKSHRKNANAPEEKRKISNRLLTQEQRCQFCFENSSRPRHLVIAIAQFTYMALPPWQPVIQGHCCILPMQHESASRTVDDNVWEEFRNFKKCLIMMFDKQDKGVVFLETVIGLARQQRHCLVECIPLPRDLAKEAPLYFKKAIDEAEDEWSQHNSKKLIRTTREKGLRRCIPKDFPYFHVEFGLDEGFVHVIDDEGKFNSNLGLNVIRGMLRLPEADMYRRQRHEPLEKQRLAVATFTQEWEPFDWTKQLA